MIIIEKKPCVYVLGCLPKRTLSVHVTPYLKEMVAHHKLVAKTTVSPFKECPRLIYVEHYDTIEKAISRKQVMQSWHEAWLHKQVNLFNPGWLDIEVRG